MEEWTALLSHSLSRRLPLAQFSRFAALLALRAPLPAPALADLLLRPTPAQHHALDPRIPLYIQALLDADLLDIAAVLHALRAHSTLRDVEAHKEDRGGSRWARSGVHEEAIMYGLAKVVGAGERPKSVPEVAAALQELTAWMDLLGVAAAAEDVMREMGAGNGVHDLETGAVRVAAAALLVAVSDNERVGEVLRKGCPKETIKAFSQSLSTFIPLLLHGSSIFAERLELYRTQTLLLLQPVDQKLEKANAEIYRIIDSTMALNMDNIPIEDIPIVNSKAGLYVYLNSLLVGRPMVDDNQLLNFLHNRYHGLVQTACVDLIVSSFDVLANAIFRNENAQTTLILRSFLINKVPLLISVLATSMFPPLSPEMCITDALSHVDTNAFPTFSSMFDDNTTDNMFSDSVRQDFCFACCLHGLIAEGSIERLIGEVPMQALPAGGRYTKDDVVQQCLSDPEKVETFADELEHMDGNAGAVAQGITEVIRRLCASKDTLPLKSLCAHLARKPSSLDVLLLFDRPITILQPICQLLDGWRYDEDQGEYQPVYEEFGSILLLVLAFVNRYDFCAVELGIQANDSFIAKLLVRGTLARPLDELSAQEAAQLGAWIKGLFNAEGGGLGDEPMSLCPPQDFYLLVPSLFSQVVLAYHHGYLNDENLRGGLEYLVDTFLLPSLIGAIKWLADHLWASQGDSNAIIALLNILISPPSISNEASLMLASILTIVAPPLDHSLRHLQRTDPTRLDIDPLSRALRPHLHPSPARLAIEPDTATAPAIRRTLHALVHWSLAPGPSATPTPYTHRQVLSAVRLLGARRLLAALVDELVLQADAGNAAVAYDVAAAIVCAPTPGAATEPLLDAQPLQGRMTLREALRMEAEAEAVKAMRGAADTGRAEIVVRLWRRVEVLMAPARGLAQGGMAEAEAEMMGVLGGEGMMGLGEGLLEGMKLEF